MQESGKLHMLKTRWWKEKRGGGKCQVNIFQICQCFGVTNGRHMIDRISDWPNLRGFTKGVCFVCLNRYNQVDWKPFGQSEIWSIRVLRFFWLLFVQPLENLATFYSTFGKFGYFLFDFWQNLAPFCSTFAKCPFLRNALCKLALKLKQKCRNISNPFTAVAAASVQQRVTFPNH